MTRYADAEFTDALNALKADLKPNTLFSLRKIYALENPNGGRATPEDDFESDRGGYDEDRGCENNDIYSSRGCSCGHYCNACY